MKFSKPAGFTLVEVLIVAAISSIVMLVIVTMMENSMRVGQTVMGLGQFSDTAALMRLILNKDTTCAAAFSPYQFVPPAGAPPVDMSKTPTEIPTLSLNGVPAVAIGGGTGTNIQITDLFFSQLTASLGNNTYLVNFRMIGKKMVGGGAVGSQNVTNDFPMVVTIDGSNNIIDCFSTTSEQQVCLDLGGTYSASTTPKCIVPPYYQN